MPSSPTTVSVRRLAGVSQSTCSIPTEPDGNDRSPNSRSSWSWWTRWAVSAETRVGRSAVEQDVDVGRKIDGHADVPDARWNGPARRLVIA